MTATVPTARQAAPRTVEIGARDNARPDGDRQSFVAFVAGTAAGDKAADRPRVRDDADLHSRQGRGGDRIDARAKALDEEADEADATDGEVGDDTTAAQALLPFLAIVDFRGAAAAAGGVPEPVAGAGSRRGGSAKQVPPSVASEDTADVAASRSASSDALLNVVDADGSAEARQATFGRSLLASLGAIPARDGQPAAAGQAAIEPQADGDAAPGEFAGQASRERSLPEAVSRSREPVDARRSEPGDAAPVARDTAQPALARSSTAAPVAQAITTSPAWLAALQRAAATGPVGGNQHASVQSLKIQLHPVELGMVTANLHMADGRMSIAIDVDTPEAYQRLSSERDTIAKSIRSNGMAVDEVVINLPQVHQAQAVRDASTVANGAGFARQDAAGNGGSGQSGGSGQTGGNRDRNHGQDVEHAPISEARPGGGAAGGVYI